MSESLTSRASLISQALIRIAASIKRPALRLRFEEAAIDLLSHVSMANFEIGLKSIYFLKAAVDLAASIYELEPINQKILANELMLLESKIKELSMTNFVNIANLFKNKESAKQLPIELPNDLPIGSEVADSIADENVQENNGMLSIATAIRQSAILEKIRSLSMRDNHGQLIGCKMKDLLTTFPDVSERTLRNDLQRLLNRGAIERIGSGGATSAYVIK